MGFLTCWVISYSSCSTGYVKRSGTNDCEWRFRPCQAWCKHAYSSVRDGYFLCPSAPCYFLIRLKQKPWMLFTVFSFSPLQPPVLSVWQPFGSSHLMTLLFFDSFVVMSFPSRNFCYLVELSRVAHCASCYTKNVVYAELLLSFWDFCAC